MSGDVYPSVHEGGMYSAEIGVVSRKVEGEVVGLTGTQRVGIGRGKDRRPVLSSVLGCDCMNVSPICCVGPDNSCAGSHVQSHGLERIIDDGHVNLEFSLHLLRHGLRDCSVSTRDP